MFAELQGTNKRKGKKIVLNILYYVDKMYLVTEYINNSPKKSIRAPKIFRRTCKKSKYEINWKIDSYNRNSFLKLRGKCMIKYIDDKCADDGTKYHVRKECLLCNYS